MRATLKLTDGHLISVSTSSAHFPTNFVRETTPETKQIIDRMKFLARWFAKSGSESTILAAWGAKI